MPAQKPRSRPKFTGDLGTPISIVDPDSPDHTILGSAIDTDAIHARRLELLAAHYAVPLDAPGAWRRLCLALAQDVVPGFQFRVARRKGRRAGEGPIDRDTLLAEVARLKREGMTIAQACRHLSRTKEIRSSISPQVLEATYHAERKRRAQESRVKREKLMLAATILPQFQVVKD